VIPFSLKRHALRFLQTLEQLACPQRGDAQPTHLTQCDIQQRATFNDLNNAIANALAQASNTSNGVGVLGMGADGGYNQSQRQDLISKVDELINALRR
jgi:hypothetical protein